MKKLRLLRTVCTVLFFLITVSANAELYGRLPLTPGGTDYQAAYDTVLDITWLTDADLSGPNTWDNQITWVGGLNTANHLGFNDWRLASMSVAAGLPTGTLGWQSWPVDCWTATELACRDNELGYMYWYNMGAGFNKTGNQTVDGVLLTDVRPFYWSGTEHEDLSCGCPNPVNPILVFLYVGGSQLSNGKAVGGEYGWAVRDGDVQENPDADGDGVNDDEDLCPDTAPEAAVDAVGCSDAQVDGDGDGVCNDGAVSDGPNGCVGYDFCRDTAISEGVPTVQLKPNHWALIDGDSEFDTVIRGKGEGPNRSYTIDDTAGCSCEQIIEMQGLGLGHTYHGCSIGAMDNWVELVNP